MIASFLAVALLAQSPSVDYVKQEEKWRVDREKSLMSPKGWLSAAGLFWLKEGENTVGSAENSDVRFPSTAPARVGVFTFRDKQVTFRAAQGVQAKIGDRLVTEAQLRSDAEENTDQVTLGDMTFFVIQRGDRTGIRLYDPNCEGRKNFKGLEWYAVDPVYRIDAKFIPYEKPKMLPILNVIGDTRIAPFPGYATFTIKGKEYRLEAEDQGDVLFFNFQDKTSGETTYGAGRYLYSEKPKDGVVVIDFNRAYSPPCAFTDFATCPLPPEGNKLEVEIPAGEKHTGH